MKTINLLLFVCLLSLTSFAQKKSEIVQYGVQIQRQYEQDLKDGDKEHILVKEEYYDYKGDLVELKEFKEGNIDKWVKYTYDRETNLIEEIELNQKGDQKERTVYKFEKGLKTEKLSYDDKDRLTKSKKYEYVYR
ncbi:MAG: hypothetical protein PF541_00975 [Prolixibacteraceae bacterium]|jgi:hypothetical protein|nr:hypothetical protein [Prolixibacteraceae bacterium]